MTRHARPGAAGGRRDSRRVGRIVRVDVDRERGVRGLGVTTVRRIADVVVAAERARGAVLSVSFVSDRTMRRLNREHLGRDRETDVIAFPLRDGMGNAVGDVYVAPGAAQRSAAELGIPTRQELVRLVVHGLLHALGHDHPEGPARVRSPMWLKQEAIVAALGARPTATR